MDTSPCSKLDVLGAHLSVVVLKAGVSDVQLKPITSQGAALGLE